MLLSYFLLCERRPVIGCSSPPPPSPTPAGLSPDLVPQQQGSWWTPASAERRVGTTLKLPSDPFSVH